MKKIIFGILLLIGMVVLTVYAKHRIPSVFAQTDYSVTCPSSDTVSVAQYLACQEKPLFKDGNNLPHLARSGWPPTSYTGELTYEKQLIDSWGYAMATSDSLMNKIMIASNYDYNKYPIQLDIFKDEWVSANPLIPIPRDSWVIDKLGNLVLDGVSKIVSAEGPDTYLQSQANDRARRIAELSSKYKVGPVIFSSESGIGVGNMSYEKFDPRVISAKGDEDWRDYMSKIETYHDALTMDKVRDMTPNREVLVTYTAGEHERSGSLPRYNYYQQVTDLPSNSLYYKYNGFNSGWIDVNHKFDLLSQILKGKYYEISKNQPLSYDFVSGGFYECQYKDQACIDLAISRGKYSDIPTYYGFLKSYYTSGSVGHLASYFDVVFVNALYGGADSRYADTTFSKSSPPHWMQQRIASSHVHALFTYLEMFLKEGTLLEGPDIHASCIGNIDPSSNCTNPAYEFKAYDVNATYLPNVRVTARKLNNQAKYLVTVWAADGLKKEIFTTITDSKTATNLPNLNLEARESGSVYLIEIINGQIVKTLIDSDPLKPSFGAKSLLSQGKL